MFLHDVLPLVASLGGPRSIVGMLNLGSRHDNLVCFVESSGGRIRMSKPKIRTSSLVMPLLRLNQKSAAL